MPRMDLSKKPFDEATLTKLRLFEQYVQGWLPVFIYTSTFKSANICDFFAGTGQDINGIPGSPLRILRKIEEFQEAIIRNRFHINVLLNEYDLEKFLKMKALVEEKLEAMSPRLKACINVQYFNDDFQRLFYSKADALKKENNLFFFDQNGVKFFHKDEIVFLEKFTRTDYLFFVASGHVHRFTETFRDIAFPTLKDGSRQDVHRRLCECYRDMLPADTQTKLFPFSLRKKNEKQTKNQSNVHGLVFASKNFLGAEKFLSIAWNENRMNGEANFDIDKEADPQLSLFESNDKISKVDQFKADLQAFALDRKCFTNEDVLEYTLLRGFATKYATECLNKLKKDGILEPFDAAKINCNDISKNALVTFRVTQHEHIKN